MCECVSDGLQAAAVESVSQLDLKWPKIPIGVSELFFVTCPLVLLAPI